MVGFERTNLLAAPDDSADLFRRQRAIVCPGFFQDALLSKLIERCRTGEFCPDAAGGLGSREVESPQRVGGAINILLQRAPLLRWIERATECGPLATVAGRVVQTLANGSDRLYWHDDREDTGRRLGITINLSDAPYDGGVFEMRIKRRDRIEWAFRHETPGTALIFDIRPNLEHRLLPLVSGGPRRVYTGWFMQDRDYS
jgi:hypothetical protein